MADKRIDLEEYTNISILSSNCTISDQSTMLVDFPHLKSQIVVHETYFSYKPMKKVYLSSPAHEECPSCYTLRIRLAPQGTGFHDVPVVRISENIH